MSTLNERLAEAMSATKKTDRKKFAKALGITPQAVGQLINGQSKSLTAENCSKAARYLGVSTDWLAAGLGEMKAGDRSAGNEWPFIGIYQSEWDSASERVKGSIEGYARTLIDQDLRRAQESLLEKSRRSA